MDIQQINANVFAIFIKIKKADKSDENFSLDVDLFDYGYLDSFGVVELLLEIKNVFEVDLSNEDFYQDLRNIRKISQSIFEKATKKSNYVTNRCSHKEFIPCAL